MHERLKGPREGLRRRLRGTNDDDFITIEGAREAINRTFRPPRFIDRLLRGPQRWGEDLSRLPSPQVGLRSTVSGGVLLLLGPLSQAESRLRHLFGVLPPSDSEVAHDDPCSPFMARDLGPRQLQRRYLRKRPLERVYCGGRRFEHERKLGMAKGMYAEVIAGAPHSLEAARARMRLLEIEWAEGEAGGGGMASRGGSDKYWGVMGELWKEHPVVAEEALQMRRRRFNDAKTWRSEQHRRAWDRMCIQKLPGSDTGALIRWEWAKELARMGRVKAARASALKIAQDVPAGEVAGAAMYWAGKWSDELGESGRAKELFGKVVRREPQSFYGWRAAHALGLPVGDFTSAGTQLRHEGGAGADEGVRGEAPRRAPPGSWRARLPAWLPARWRRPGHARVPLPTGSLRLRRLHAAGRAEAAWEQWIRETSHGQDPSMAERIVDGILRVHKGDYIGGIGALSSLEMHARSPLDVALLHALHSQRAYWDITYPLPHLDMAERWSRGEAGEEARRLHPLLVMGVMRKESCFEDRIRSTVGARGLMQVMPDTAAWIANNLDLDGYSLDVPEDNVRLGTWFLRWSLYDMYGKNAALALASYNAGPGNVDSWIDQHGMAHPGGRSRRWRWLGGGAEAAADWDKFIELIPYQETKKYVKSVLGNFWNYQCLHDPARERPIRTVLESRAGVWRRMLPRARPHAKVAALSSGELEDLIDPNSVDLQVEVRDGDTLTAIAERYGLAPQAVFAANPLMSPDDLAVGMQLTLPLAGGAGGKEVAHVVKAGETLESIARRYGMRVPEVTALNPRVNPRMLDIGMQVVVRSGAGAAPEEPARTAPAPAECGNTYCVVPDP